MDDGDDVDRVAAEYLEMQGTRAVADLHERAEIAAANGDQLSAETWSEIADAAERLLQKRC